ncbi:hypothetical protein [Paraliomyxa miuraensis]|uniref:hypothetical protein n=1 Tax=Paraliomyxa miuraensis TaxID=376150 RepID=UPI00224EA11D|nr:hypothetical protein [Paraliomyxa miuraensis]MCX4241869.1 hypothetical protein [Paraliomyxa miuraensis]
MELLVFCRCYRPWGASAEEPARRELGACVGDRAAALGWGERLCAFVEVRLPVTVVDPCTEIELLVAKAFAAWGHPGGGRVLRFRNARGSVAMLLEPGFERARDLSRALQPLLPQARTLLERAQAPVVRARPVVHAGEGWRSAVPEVVAEDRAMRLRLPTSSPGRRFAAPHVGG